jgi:hypothetical protein
MDEHFFPGLLPGDPHNVLAALRCLLCYFIALISDVKMTNAVNRFHGCFVHTDLAPTGAVVVYVPGVPFVGFVA